MWIIDYDLPESIKVRQRFYRAFHRLLKERRETNPSFVIKSTYSVILCDDWDLAQQIYHLAKSYGRAHFYRVERIE